MMTATKSGKFCVYHKDEAGSPDVHNSPDGDWYFEPRGGAEGDVYSKGHPTREAALAAAERWENFLEMGEAAAKKANERIAAQSADPDPTMAAWDGGRDARNAADAAAYERNEQARREGHKV